MAPPWLKPYSIAFGLVALIYFSSGKPSWPQIMAIAIGVGGYVALAAYCFWTGFIRPKSPASRVRRLLVGGYLTICLILPIAWLPFVVMGILLGTQFFFLTPFHAHYLARMAVAQYENIRYVWTDNVEALDVIYQIQVGSNKYSGTQTIYCATRSGASMSSFKNAFESHLYRGYPVAVGSPAMVKTEGDDVLIADNRNQLCQRLWPERRLKRGWDPYRLYYLTDMGRTRHRLEFEFKGELHRMGRVTVFKPRIMARRKVPARGAIGISDVPPFTSVEHDGAQIPPLD